MTFLVKIAAGLAMLSIAACDTANSGRATSARAPIDASGAASPGTARVSDAVQVVANIMNDAARNSPPNSAGMSLRGATARGNTLIVGFTFPFPGAGIPREEFRVLYGARVTAQTRQLFCEGDIFRSLLAVGATIQVDFYGRDGVIFGNSVVTSC